MLTRLSQEGRFEKIELYRKPNKSHLSSRQWRTEGSSSKRKALNWSNKAWTSSSLPQHKTQQLRGDDAHSMSELRLHPWPQSAADRMHASPTLTATGWALISSSMGLCGGLYQMEDSEKPREAAQEPTHTQTMRCCREGWMFINRCDSCSYTHGGLCGLRSLLHLLPRFFFPVPLGSTIRQAACQSHTHRWRRLSNCSTLSHLKTQLMKRGAYGWKLDMAHVRLK